MAFIPASEVFVAFLENVGSREMNVDGSVSPLDFEYNVPDRLAVLGVRLLISTATDMTNSTFGDLPTLTNGITVQVGANVFPVMKNNEDLSQIWSLRDPDPRYGFGGLRTAEFGEIYSRQYIVEDSEVISLQVADDLTGLSRMTCAVFGYKIND